MLVTIDGVFMGATPKSRERNGVTETSVSVDVYQPTSPSANKTVTVKVEDGSNLNRILEKYKMGSAVKMNATISAFNGNMYAKHESGLI